MEVVVDVDVIEYFGYIFCMFCIVRCFKLYVLYGVVKVSFKVCVGLGSL